MLLIHDCWRAEAAIALAVVGAVLLVTTLVPASASVRRGRMGDVVETATLISLLPLMVLAAGFFDWSRAERVATKKDLVEAHSFSRRRLVTAFVCGAPGGREVEPVRPGRVLIGGIALSVLLLAGAAIAGFLVGRPNSAWLENGSFVISKETGERYVVLRGGDDPLLQRVPNYLSAQLLLGQAGADR